MKYKRAIIVKSECVDPDTVKIEEKNIVKPGNERIHLPDSPREHISAKGGGSMHDKGYYLDEIYDWQIVGDSLGNPVLICTRKCPS